MNIFLFILILVAILVTIVWLHVPIYREPMPDTDRDWKVLGMDGSVIGQVKAATMEDAVLKAAIKYGAHLEVMVYPTRLK